MTSGASIGGKIAVSAMRRSLVATLPARLSDDVLDGVRESILDRLRTMTARALILDMSAVEAVDSREFGTLADIGRMARLMGTPAYFTGLQPGVVSALIDLDVDTSDIEVVPDVTEALERFDPPPEPAEGPPRTGGAPNGEQLPGPREGDLPRDPDP